jgi:hypothetical protein
MRKVLILAMVALAACSARGDDADDIQPVSNVVGDWDGNLAAVNNSGVRGSARAQSAGLATGAALTIAGATAGAQHPWHIHRGVCGDGGPIVGNATDYPVLTVGADGNASATATIRVALNENESYYVNVHRSPTDLGTIVSCGPIDND